MLIFQIIIIIIIIIIINGNRSGWLQFKARVIHCFEVMLIFQINARHAYLHG